MVDAKQVQWARLVTVNAGGRYDDSLCRKEKA
jgi:hypothetical protein